MTLEPLLASTDEVAAFIDAVAEADGVPPLSEHKLLRVEGAEDAVVTVWGEDGEMMAVSVAARHAGDDPHWAFEVAVGLRHRHQELERAAIGAAESTVPSGARSSLWVQRPEQLAAAEALGYRQLRRVLQMEGPFPDVAESADVSVGIATDSDDHALIDLHNRAFAGHREASGMTEQRLAELKAMPWFDPNGVFVGRFGDRLVGFCWTKLHPDGDGEVYLLAVDPEVHGRGVGEVLARAGYADLARRGANRAMLWVDGDNASAIDLYRRLGLEPGRVSVEMVRD